MTLAEFVSRLTANGQVTLSEGIRLEAGSVDGLVPSVLAGALESSLPGDAEIHSGWQTQTLGDRADVPHEWVLVVGDGVVVVRATRRLEQEGIFDVVVRELPLGAVVPDVRLSYFTDRFRGGPHTLISAKVLVETAGETLTVEMQGRDGLEAFTRFVRELRAAIGRARRL